MPKLVSLPVSRDIVDFRKAGDRWQQSDRDFNDPLVEILQLFGDLGLRFKQIFKRIPGLYTELNDDLDGRLVVTRNQILQIGRQFVRVSGLCLRPPAGDDAEYETQKNQQRQGVVNA